MKKQFTFILLILSAGFCFSQGQIQLYNVDDLPQSLMLNPGAEVHFDKHLGIPLLSGIHVQGGSTGVNFYDLFEKNSDFNNRLQKAVFSLSKKDYFSVNEQLEIFSVGFRLRDGDYISGGWYQELDAISYYPEDFAILAYEGNANYINKYFDLSDAVAKGEIVSVFHLGYNHQVSKALTIGARGKIYGSMFNFQSTNNQGYFVTRDSPDGNNVYSHELINAQFLLQTSGTDGFKALRPKQLAKNALLSKNMGVGIDLGFSYKFNYNWQVTGSMVDFGVIANKGTLREYYFSGNYKLDGIGFTFPQVNNGESSNDYFNNIEDEFFDNVKYGDRIGKGYLSWRPLKLYGSIDYGFGQKTGCDCLHPAEKRFVNHTGLQLAAIKRPLSPQFAVTAFFDTQLTDFIRTKFTYTVDPYSYSNLGFLVSTQVSIFNFYVSADNVLNYTNLAKANSLSLQLGLQLVLKNK
ncbi:MAG: DUF5723 family protein [Leeuwenhoekiella sp.]